MPQAPETTQKANWIQVSKEINEFSENLQNEVIASRSSGIVSFPDLRSRLHGRRRNRFRRPLGELADASAPIVRRQVVPGRTKESPRESSRERSRRERTLIRRQVCRGSFSAVSKTIFATKYLKSSIEFSAFFKRSTRFAQYCTALNSTFADFWTISQHI